MVLLLRQRTISNSEKKAMLDWEEKEIECELNLLKYVFSFEKVPG